LIDPLRTVIEAPVVLLQVSKLLLATNRYAECDYLAELLFTDQSLRGDPTLLASLAAVHHLLGNTDDDRGDPRSASKQFFKSIRAFQVFLPPDHPLMSASYNNIGSMYFKENDYDEAIKFHQKALNCQLKSGSPDTDAIATYSNNIGAVYFAQGKYAEALKYLHRAATILERLSSEEKLMNLCFIYQKIAASYWRMDKGKEALEYYKRTLDIQLVCLPPTAHQISVTYFNLSTAYARSGQIDEAVRCAEKSVEQLLKSLPPDHPEVKENQAQLEIVRQKQWLQQVLSS
jgi:tetratricopeptide (TPR) repeat protein